MPLDYSNPHTLRFIIENFDKENEKRILWFTKNKEKIVSAATFGPNFKDYQVEDISRASIELSLPSLSCQHIESSTNRRKKSIKDAPVLATSATKKFYKIKDIPEQMITEFKADTIMKPVEDEIVNIFYEGIPEGGRREYLKARHRKAPEEKYYLDQTNNHAIGWQLKEGANINPPLQHGRNWVLTHELNNRAGPQPDPYYYQQPQIDPYVKCTYS